MKKIIFSFIFGIIFFVILKCLEVGLFDAIIFASYSAYYFFGLIYSDLDRPKWNFLLASIAIGIISIFLRSLNPNFFIFGLILFLFASMTCILAKAKALNNAHKRILELGKVLSGFDE